MKRTISEVDSSSSSLSSDSDSESEYKIINGDESEYESDIYQPKNGIDYESDESFDKKDIQYNELRTEIMTSREKSKFGLKYPWHVNNKIKRLKFNIEKIAEILVNTQNLKIKYQFNITSDKTKNCEEIYSVVKDYLPKNYYIYLLNDSYNNILISFPYVSDKDNDDILEYKYRKRLTRYNISKDVFNTDTFILSNEILNNDVGVDHFESAKIIRNTYGIEIYTMKNIDMLQNLKYKYIYLVKFISNVDRININTDYTDIIYYTDTLLIGKRNNFNDFKFNKHIINKIISDSDFEIRYSEFCNRYEKFINVRDVFSIVRLFSRTDVSDDEGIDENISNDIELIQPGPNILQNNVVLSTLKFEKFKILPKQYFTIYNMKDIQNLKNSIRSRHFAYTVRTLPDNKIIIINRYEFSKLTEWQCYKDLAFD